VVGGGGELGRWLVGVVVIVVGSKLGLPSGSSCHQCMCLAEIVVNVVDGYFKKKLIVLSHLSCHGQEDKDSHL